MDLSKDEKFTSTKDIEAGDDQDQAVKPAQTLTQDEEIAIQLANYVPGTPEEKRLVRKIDFILIPCLWLMYLLAYLDRGNIGNANAAGMSVDLKMSDNDYSLLVHLFFVAYFLFEVPSNMILNKMRPSVYLSTIVWVWGAAVTGMSQASNYEGFLAGRFFLGAIEAGLFPGAVYLLTCWYTKTEIAKRLCIFYTSGTVAPAFGGILAGAILKSLEGAHGIAGWRWLLLVEGLMTVVCGFALYFLLLDYPINTRRFLTRDECRLAHVRMLHDRQLNVAASSKPLTSWQAFKAVITDGKSFVFMVLYQFMITGTCITYFVPTIVRNMGYTEVTAQWMTVPIWFCGTAIQLILSWTSDKTQDRQWHIVGIYTVSAIGCLIAGVVYSDAAKYAMMCFLVGSLYTGLPLMFNWVSEWMPFPNQKRSVAIALVNSFGHLGVIYGSYLWPSANAPRHTLGFSTVGAMMAAGIVLTIAAPWLFKLLPKTPATKAERDLWKLNEREAEAAQ